MGLDMYLERKIFVRHYGEGDPTYQVTVNKHGQPMNINSKNITYVVEEIGYWRKANAIHKWFVTNIQDGEDNCRSYYVSKNQLIQLINDCQDVLNNPGNAHDLLPTAGGFFFGSTDYDERYVDCLNHTIKVCQEALAAVESDPNSSIYYHSSW